jgi:hypothetical protein
LHNCGYKYRAYAIINYNIVVLKHSTSAFNVRKIVPSCFLVTAVLSEILSCSLAAIKMATLNEDIVEKINKIQEICKVSSLSR